MQHSPEDIKRRLLACIDDDSNVTDMATCLGIIGILEQTAITRKILEDTRLGKYVNDIRRKTGDQELSKRLKNLVRKWRDTCQTESVNGVTPKGPGPGGGASSNGRQSISPPFSAPSSIRGHGGLSPYSLPSSGNTSPVGIISAPSTPSTLPQRSQTISPVLSVSKSTLSKTRMTSPCLGRQSPVVSPPLHATSMPSSPSKHSSAISMPPVVTLKDEPNYNPSLEKVPRTNAANKRRRRKDEYGASEYPSSKRLKSSLSNGFDEDCSRDSFCSIVSNDRISRASGDGSASIIQELTQNNPPVRRSGRRRKLQGSQGSNSSRSALDPLRQKMAVIGAKSHKVKTTSQLVAELAERKGDVLLAKRASILEQGKDRDSERSPLRRPDHDTVTQNKLEHMERFLKSQPDPIIVVEDDDDEVQIEDEDGEEGPNSAPLSTDTNSTDSSIVRIPILIPHRPDSPASNMDLLGIKANETAEEILARLPPIDINLINWDSDVEAESNVLSEIIEEDREDELDEVDRLLERSNCIDMSLVETLHTTNVECQNGNFDMDGRFREWHEVILQKAYQDTPLVVLPYVVTDF